MYLQEEFVRGIRHFAFQKHHLPSSVHFCGNYDSALHTMWDFKLSDVLYEQLEYRKWNASGWTCEEILFLWIIKYKIMYFKCVIQRLMHSHTAEKHLRVDSIIFYWASVFIKGRFSSGKNKKLYNIPTRYHNRWLESVFLSSSATSN